MLFKQVKSVKKPLGTLLSYGLRNIQEICMFDYVKVATGSCFVDYSFCMSERQLTWKWAPQAICSVTF